MLSTSRRIILVNSLNKRIISNYVKVVEVGPRDGLQNERKLLPTSQKITLINRLSKTGISAIEVTSFVSPKWIPQMQDNSEVYQKIEKKIGVNYSALVPNVKGLENAIKVNVNEIAIFVSASESFSHKNLNCSINESIEKMISVAKIALKNDMKIRGYISCIVACPYEGSVKPSTVARLTEKLLDVGCYEISLGDTIGVGTPKNIVRVLNEVRNLSRIENMTRIAIHCHDTFGQALTNIYASLENDVRVFDSSVGGLGGCPYAAGASGNISTEDLLYFLHGEGFFTGIDLNETIDIGNWISELLGRENKSKVGIAMQKRN